jgi:hypothetical protein
MNDLKEYVQSNIENFKVLSVSTNKVMEFSYEGTEYVIRKQLLTEDRLSPFWQMMKDVFGSDFRKQRACSKSVYELLSKNPHIKPAELVLVDDEEAYQIYRKMPGMQWEPDEFPEDKNIAYQLGQYIGYNHSVNLENYDIPGMNNDCLHKKLINYMEAVISSHWNSDTELDLKVRAYFEQLKKMTIHANEGYCLIMTDMSANQFLFDEASITACVDLDAYVAGPKEWELALVKYCVEDYESFREGYECYQTLSDREELMDYYLFVMFLGDIWGKEEMKNFFNMKNEK